jgi:hypothetical protein
VGTCYAAFMLVYAALESNDKLIEQVLLHHAAL